jgi:hypothetical protein
MRRMLLVGLGGSGGKTLGFLMDELRFRLGDSWTRDTLPECWQFVHIDVPSVADTQGSNLASGVQNQGGRYIGLTDSTSSYNKLDSVLVNQLATNDQLGYFARWRPDPSQASKIPISAGAGAARAVGRVVTLSAASNIFAGLTAVVEKIQGQRANEDLAWLQQKYMKSTDPDAQTLVMMVSSISGGSGASMVLDVADLIRGLQESNIDGEHTAAFLYTPDVFGDLIAQPGAGAIATISELLAALNRSNEPWTKEEWRTISGGGAPMPTSPGRGPLNLFPVGAKSHGQPFGDSPEDVYRGFSRMLAPLFVDKNVQNDYVAYVTTNALKRAKENPDKSTLMTQAHVSMWSSPKTTFSHFSAWGAATLTLGHDRYTEYSAQRLARYTVEHLTSYHITHGEGLPPHQAVSRLVGFARQGFLDSLGLSQPGEPMDAKSISRQALGDNNYRTFVSGLTQPFMSALGAAANAVVQKLKGQAASSAAPHEQVIGYVNESLTNWIVDLQKRLEIATLAALANYGLAVTLQLLHELRSEIGKVLGTFPTTGVNPSHTSLTDKLTGEIGKSIPVAGKAAAGLIPNGGAIATALNQGIARAFAGHGQEIANPLLTNALSEFQSECIDVLSAQLEKINDDVLFALGAQSVGGVSAAFRNAHISRWPSDLNPIPSHFGAALNEVMVNKVEDFDKRFREHLSGAVSASGGSEMEEATKQIITQQIAGQEGKSENITGWALKYDSSGAHPHIGREQNFFPSKLATATRRTPSKAKYAPKLTPEDLLDYARSWVDIPGTSFRKFTGAGFASWLAEHSDKVDRHGEFLTAIRTAMNFASPLVEIDQKLVEAIHGPNSFGYSYWFSSLPLSQEHPLVDEIKNYWQGYPASRPGNNSALDKACSIGSDPKEIHISSTPAAPYSAIVFKSLMSPVRRDWESAVSSGATQDFWEWRRARPLGHFIPASPEWIMAFLQGWIVGRITGLIQMETLPEKHNSKQVRVFDLASEKWHEFPTDLLGVTSLGVRMSAWGADESNWNIPVALLESLALAMARCRGDMGEPLAPLDPYIAVLRMGLELKVEPAYRSQPVGANQEVDNPLDAWFRGDANASGTASQLNFALGADRLAATTKWLESVQQYIEQHLMVEVLDGENGNFWKLNREFELRDQLHEAVTTLLRELKRDDLGKTEAKEKRAANPVSKATLVVEAPESPEA